MPAVYGYTRASTIHQEDSPDIQKMIISKYCQRCELGEPIFFVDMATSGKFHIKKRKAGRELLVRLKEGDTLIVTKMDRAFRSTADAVVMLDELVDRKVKFIALDAPWCDINSYFGMAMLQMMAIFATIERKRISERTREAFVWMRKEGLAITRPRTGYKIVRRMHKGRERSFLAPDEDVRKIMRLVHILSTENGWNSHKITRHLAFTLRIKHPRTGEPYAESTIRRMIKAYPLLDGMDRQISERQKGRGFSVDRAIERIHKRFCDSRHDDGSSVDEQHQQGCPVLGDSAFEPHQAIEGADVPGPEGDEV